jgi:hypothetical protein
MKFKLGAAFSASAVLFTFYLMRIGYMSHGNIGFAHIFILLGLVGLAAWYICTGAFDDMKNNDGHNAANKTK